MRSARILEWPWRAALGIFCSLSAPAVHAQVWIPLGPAPQANGYVAPPAYAPEDVSGHVRALAWSPDVDGGGTPALFLGAANGGVWRTTDPLSPAPTWKPLTDQLGLAPEQAAGAIQVGSLAVDSNRPSRVYAGTGRPFFGYGAGLLKSTDGGDHWTLLGADALGGQSISKVIVDPTDPTGDTLYCGTTFGSGYRQWGIYKSMDGGTSWSDVSGDIGAPVLVTDMTYTVTTDDHLVLFAGVIAAYPGDTFGGVWRSEDGGDTWTHLQGGLPTGEGVGNVVFAADPVPGPAPAIYAAIADPAGQLVDIYKSTSHGAAWASTDPPDFVKGWGTWALALGLAPDGTVYAGSFSEPFNEGILQSTDGGTTWNVIDTGTNGEVPHTDHHAWAFGGGLAFDGTDGGIWRFHPLPDGAAGPGVWDNLNTAGLSTIQSNGVALRPSEPETILTSGEINGIARRSADTGGLWATMAAGTFGGVRFAPTDDSIAYSSGPPPYRFEASHDGGFTWADAYDGLPDGADDFPYYPPFDVSAQDAQRVILGGTKVYETQDGGTTWAPISDALLQGGTVSALAYKPTSDEIIYAALSGPGVAAHVFRTGDGGTTWEDTVDSPPWDSGRLVTALAVAAGHVQTAYLSLDGFGGSAVWKTSDGGATWEDISAGLPHVPVNALAMDESGRLPTLYAGTDVGVWVSTDDGAQWERFGTGLPDARVSALQLDFASGRLAAALYGRGVWLAPLRSGDVNNDQRVNLADAVEILRIAGGLRDADAGEILRGDTAPDGRLTLADAISIARLTPNGAAPPAPPALSLP
jgi:hypothetical protein